MVATPATTHDPEPKALACYGLRRTDPEQIWLRFGAERPVSALTTQFGHWSCWRWQRQGKKALRVVWDNASWHVSGAVRHWVRAHNTEANRRGDVRLVLCQLPAKSPWLNRIEPHWLHGKKAIVEPQRKLPAAALMARVHTYCGCQQWPLLSHKVS